MEWQVLPSKNRHRVIILCAMAAAEVLISRTEVDPSQLGKIPLPTGISRKVFESVANMMITVTGDEGRWHGQISACVSVVALKSKLVLF